MDYIGTISRLLTANINEIFDICRKGLLEQGYTLIESDPIQDYLIGIPPGVPSQVALVAHLDTLVPKNRDTGLHLKPVSLQITSNGLITNANGVLGADDRAGVYVVLEAIKEEVKPIVIFTNHEELMGIGVKKLCADNALAPYEDMIHLFVEMDRQGLDEYVFYSWSLPNSIHKIIKKYGYEENIGSYSDVKDLTDHTRIPHLNISVGYRHQHSPKEQLSLYGLSLCVSTVKALLKEEIPKEIIAARSNKKNKSRFSSFSSFPSWDGHLGDDSSYEEEDYEPTEEELLEAIFELDSICEKGGYPAELITESVKNNVLENYFINFIDGKPSRIMVSILGNCILSEHEKIRGDQIMLAIVTLIPKELRKKCVQEFYDILLPFCKSEKEWDIFCAQLDRTKPYLPAEAAIQNWFEKNQANKKSVVSVTK